MTQAQARTAARHSRTREGQHSARRKEEGAGAGRVAKSMAVPMGSATKEPPSPLDGVSGAGFLRCC